MLEYRPTCQEKNDEGGEYASVYLDPPPTNKLVRTPTISDKLKHMIINRLCLAAFDTSSPDDMRHWGASWKQEEEIYPEDRANAPIPRTIYASLFGSQ